MDVMKGSCCREKEMPCTWSLSALGEIASEASRHVPNAK